MPYRFAIIGCGKIARRHAEQISANGLLIAICDIVQSKALEFSKLFGGTPYFSIGELLQIEKIDVVSVCSPNGLHKEHSILALKSGNHVLCEKPMAISVTDGLSMIRVAAESGKRLFVVKQNRYNPPVQLIKKLLDEGALGKIFSFQINCFWNRSPEYYQDTWRGTKTLDGGTLYTQFSHFIDLLYWFLGDVMHVYGKRINYLHRREIEFEDTGAVIIEMKNGALGTLHYTVNTFGKNMEGSFTLFGERGTIKIGGQYLNEITFFSVEGKEEPIFQTSRPQNQYGFYEGSMSNHDIVYKNLVKALNDPEHKMLEANEALKTIEIIEKIYDQIPVLKL